MSRQDQPLPQKRLHGLDRQLINLEPKIAESEIS